MSKPVAVRHWEQLVRDHGCVVSRENANIQLHHVLGRTMKHNKVLIGPWYVLPLAWRYHDVASDNPWNVTHWPKRFEVEFGRQRDLFDQMVQRIRVLHKEIPLPEEVHAAIMDFGHR